MRYLGWFLAVAAASAQTTTVDVIVTGRDNRPIAGLAASDFRVTENKQPRRILTATPLASAPREPIARDPELFTNRGPDTQASLIAIVLDVLNTSPAVLDRAQSELAKALERTEYSGRIGVLYFDGALFLLGPFSNRPAEQAALVRNWKRPADSEARRRSIYTQSANAFAAGRDVRDTPAYQATSAALDTIAQSLAAVEGRKSLLWVASTFPFAFSARSNVLKQERNGATLNHGFETAQRTNLAVYPVALLNVPPFPEVAMPSMSQRAQVRFQSSLTMMRNSVSELRLSQLDALRDATGGRVLDIDDLRYSLETAAADTRAVYRLVFESPPAKTTESRSLRIETPGRDAQLLHRAATPYLITSSADAILQRAFERLATSPLDATVISLRVRRGADSLRLSAGPEGLLAHDRRLAIDAAIALLDEKGTVLSWAANRFEIDLSSPVEAAFARKGIEWEAPVGPAVRYRVIVRDQRIGLAGSVTLPGIPHGNQ
jgi:VWFA-related protein